MSLESLPRVCLVVSVAPSPLPRGPTPAITHIHTQLPETCSSLISKAPSSSVCAHRPTHIPACRSFGSLTRAQNYTQRMGTHKHIHTVTIRCTHPAFSLTDTLTPAKLPLAHLCPHTCTHIHTQMVGGWRGQDGLQPSSLVRQRDIHASLLQKKVEGTSPPPGRPLSSRMYSPSSPESSGF